MAHFLIIENVRQFLRKRLMIWFVLWQNQNFKCKWLLQNSCEHLWLLLSMYTKHKKFTWNLNQNKNYVETTACFIHLLIYHILNLFFWKIWKMFLCCFDYNYYIYIILFFPTSSAIISNISILTTSYNILSSSLFFTSTPSKPKIILFNYTWWNKPVKRVQLRFQQRKRKHLSTIINEAPIHYIFYRKRYEVQWSLQYIKPVTRSLVCCFNRIRALMLQTVWMTSKNFRIGGK